MHVSLAQIVHRATTDEHFSPASMPWCVNGCCRRRCGSSSVVVEGGSRLAAVANTADWYQHLHLGMNSLMLMESMIRAAQAVAGAVLSAWPGGLLSVLCRITVTLCPWWSLLTLKFLQRPMRKYYAYGGTS